MKAIVDEQLVGWKNLHERNLQAQYEEIRTVGEHSDLPKGITDQELGTYCRREVFVLLTCDRKVYVDFFESGKETIHISQYGTNEQSGQTIYVLSITD